jgi:hypothetical protein
LSRTLLFKDELIKELSSPDGCQAVQEKGENALGGLASSTQSVPKNLTPQLAQDLPSILEEEIAKLEELEAEAETCAAS